MIVQTVERVNYKKSEVCRKMLNSPYKAQNAANFWKRWHITLSRFGLRLFQKPTGEDIKNHRRS